MTKTKVSALAAGGAVLVGLTAIGTAVLMNSAAPTHVPAQPVSIVQVAATTSDSGSASVVASATPTHSAPVVRKAEAVATEVTSDTAPVDPATTDPAPVESAPVQQPTQPVVQAPAPAPTVTDYVAPSAPGLATGPSMQCPKSLKCAPPPPVAVAPSPSPTG